jgi:hypothetical protein
MIAVLRLAALLFIILTVIYLILSFGLRQIALKEAREAWEAAETRIDWETFREAKLKTHDRAMRRKLVLGVYILPTALIGALVYFVNFA